MICDTSWTIANDLFTVVPCGRGATYANSSGGFYTSRGSSTYRSDAFCQWLIAGPEDASEIRVRFTELSVTADDVVRVYQGPSIYTPLVAQFSGEVGPSDITVPGTNNIITCGEM